MALAGCELRLPPDVRFVGLARLVVTTAARQAGMADARVEDLRIAVSEATANAISAHNRSRQAAPIVLSFGVGEGGRFEVLIADAGVDAPPDDAVPAAEWGALDDLGVTLIRGLADDVEFTTAEDERVDMRFAVGLDADDDSD